ncbi:hypothetical protein BpHYR1_002883, partial [Brachionus plicatilis]
SKITRRDFIIKLVEELYETTKGSRNSQASSSNSQPTTPKTPATRKRLASVDLNVDSTPSKKMDTKKDKKNCQIRFCNQNKTNVTCISCKKYCCGTCCKEQKNIALCQKCFEDGKKL